MKSTVTGIRRWKRRTIARLTFPGSADYWKTRYAKGGNSGAGSFGELAHYKAEVLNQYVSVHEIKSVIEFGCGDGNQLSLAKYPHYLGFDVSDVAVGRCKSIFCHDVSKTFEPIQNYRGQQAELALSLDVIYRLVEGSVLTEYMTTLLRASTKYVIIYSSNTETIRDSQPHVRHRQFSRYVEFQFPDWTLTQHLLSTYPFHENIHTGSLSDFFIYSARSLLKGGV